jgi:hypothetical protein
MVERDKRDSSRDTAPLKPAEDAVTVETSDLDPDEVTCPPTCRARGSFENCKAQSGTHLSFFGCSFLLLTSFEPVVSLTKMFLFRRSQRLGRRWLIGCPGCPSLEIDRSHAVTAMAAGQQQLHPTVEPQSTKNHCFSCFLKLAQQNSPLPRTFFPSLSLSLPPSLCLSLSLVVFLYILYTFICPSPPILILSPLSWLLSCTRDISAAPNLGSGTSYGE